MMFGQRSVSEAYPSIKSQPMTIPSRTTSNSSSARFQRTSPQALTGRSRSTLETEGPSGETAGCVAADPQAPRIRFEPASYVTHVTHVTHVNHENHAETDRTSNPPENRSSRSP